MRKKPSEQKDAPPPSKARQILHDKAVRGHPLTKPQRGYLGAIAAKAKKGTT